ncbi:glycosyltransferase family 4 protein [Novosphingobium album (ex Liu et al. 2023)]|uniref:Glycosyltransferase family 4 protein n=1 Tax=Novosphingobium album (ex Liu et al. 2023) TaxID=3031130 RepID=A0ABT5WKA5_9SPHN|nr:glycosyltransferase family 4 protein [Novosphingobium album (ex Liu et al. 2023)]MDE8650469.1 glycosyltransferase family 4 protein [Novosphingobium album (ex Liu et al. 2023)]
MVKSVVIQRVVPHYRVPVFRKLHEELGWQVACANVGPSHGLNCALPKDHAWLTGFDFQRQKSNEYRAKVPLAQILRETGAEALVCEFSLQLSSTWRLALGGAAIPFAFWSQGWNRERGFERLKDRIVQKTRLLLLGRADAQLVYSEESARYLNRELGAKMPVFVARNTLAMDEMPGRAIDASPVDPLAPHIVSVGRLTPEKHVPRVIEAFLRLRASFPGARMTVVGDGPDRPAVEAAATPGGEAVTLRGAVYDEDEIAKVFQSASLLVIGGSVGLSVNHALAYGVPVMIFDDAFANHHHPEHAYVIEGTTGFRVRDTGVDGLAAAMRQALAPPGPRAALKEKLSAYVEHELSMDRMIDGFRGLDEHFARTLKKPRA